MSAERIEDIIDQLGETVTLRRTGQSDLTVKMSMRRYTESHLPENDLQGDITGHMCNREIAAASWPGPPKQNDKIIRDGKTLNVESCETRNWHEDSALHILQLRG